MPAISVRNLRKSYAGRTAVDGVTFDVEAGRVLGLLGPNGAGKTTTVECLTGLRRRDSGDVEVLGCDPARDPARLRAQVGVSLQSSALPDKLRVQEALALFASFYAEPADPGGLLERLGLGPVRGKRWASLSGGQQQRLAIALALVGRPRVAVLDELTTGLDPQARREVWDLVRAERERGTAVVLVTHSMEEAQVLCDEVAVVQAGRLRARGTPAALVERFGDAGRVRLRTATLPDVADLLAVAGVRDARVDADAGGFLVTVDGGGDLVLAVTARLARQGVPVHDLQVHQATLEDAYVALTTTPPAATPAEERP